MGVEWPPERYVILVHHHMSLEDGSDSLRVLKFLAWLDQALLAPCMVQGSGSPSGPSAHRLLTASYREWVP